MTTFTRVLAGLAIVFALLCGVFAAQGTPDVAASAQAATPSLGAGDQINDTLNILGVDVAAGICTVAAVGTDKFGNRLALTAGHCSAVGKTIVKDGLRFDRGLPNPINAPPVGVVRTSVTTFTGAQQLGKLDFMFIEVSDHVTLRPSGVKIASPKPGETIHKFGWGMFSQREDSGTITDVTASDVRVSIKVNPGDSGGWGRNDEGDLVTISSRGFSDYTSRDSVFARVDTATRYADEHNLVGAGFQPL